MTFDSTLDLGGNLTVQAATGTVTFTGLVSIGTNNLTVDSSAITLISAGIAGSTGSVNIDATTRTDVDGAIALTGAGTVNLEKAVVSGVNVTTDGGTVTFEGPASTNTGAVEINTGTGANVTFDSTLDLGGNLTVQAATGTVTFTGLVSIGTNNLTVDSSAITLITPASPAPRGASTSTRRPAPTSTGRLPSRGPARSTWRRPWSAA